MALHIIYTFCMFIPTSLPINVKLLPVPKDFEPYFLMFILFYVSEKLTILLHKVVILFVPSFGLFPPVCTFPDLTFSLTALVFLKY